MTAREAPSPREHDPFAGFLRGRDPALRALVRSTSQFADRPALWCNGYEIVHAHDDGTLDVRLTRTGLAAHRPLPTGVHRRGTGDWIEIAPAVPLDTVRALVTTAARVHAALPSKALPTKPALARRQARHRSVTK